MVRPAGHVGHPRLVIQIPLHRLPDTGLEGFSRLPAEFAFDLGGVDGVAAVMAGAIGDVGNLFLVRLAVSPWAEFVEDGAQGMHDIQIRLLVPATDVIGLAEQWSLT